MCIHFFSFFNREQIELANIIKPTEIEEEEEEKPPPTSIGPSMFFYPNFVMILSNFYHILSTFTVGF